MPDVPRTSQWSYQAAAGITLPRTADTQYRAGPQLPAGARLLPGDLVYQGDPNTRITHVALYIGGGRVIEAPSSANPST